MYSINTNRVLRIFMVVLFSAFYSCQNDKKEPYFVTENAIQELAGDSSKTWKLSKRFNNGYRMNMGDCFLSYRVTYNADYTTEDSNSKNSGCGESLSANWELTKTEFSSYLKLSSSQIPLFFNTTDTVKFFKINKLSNDELVVQFKHQQFSAKSTIIIDHLVPEDITIEGRDFHH